MPTSYLGTIEGVGDAKTLLLKQLNKEIREKENPDHVDYTLEQFDFSDPERVTVPNPQKNTKIYFGPKITSGYAGVRKVFYNRIHTSEFKEIRVDYNGESTLVELLPKINEYLGLLITAEEIVDKPITAPSGDQQVLVDLVFKPESLMYYGDKEIKIGTNDPTGNSPINEFNGYMTLGFSQVVEKNDQLMLKPLGLTFDHSNIKRKTHDLADMITDNDAGSFGRSFVTKQQYKDLEFYPFVGYWNHPDTNLVTAMDTLGNIYELQDQADGWEFKSNVFNIEKNNYKLNQIGLKSNQRVKCAAQAGDGIVYFLGKETQGAPSIYKITTNGLVSKVNFPTARMKTLSSADWEDLKISDMVIVGSRIWFAVEKAKTQYDIHASKSRDLPSIEVFNISTLSTNYYPLGKTQTQFGSLELTQVSKLKLMTPLPGSAHCDAVGLVKNIKDNISTYFLAHFAHQSTGEYLASVLPIDLPIKDESLVTGLCGFEVSAGQVVAKQSGIAQENPVIEVVQVCLPVSGDKPNQFFYDKLYKDEKSYYEWGIVSFTRVSKRPARTAWFKTVSKFSKEAPIEAVSLFSKGSKSHVFFQNSQGVIRPMFIQHESQPRFEVKFDLSATVGQSNGFVHVSPIAHGQFLTPVVQSRNTPDFILQQPVDEEQNLPEINFSFVGIEGNDHLKWFTSSSDSSALVERKPTSVYAHMSSAPVATLSVNNDLYYIDAQQQIVFKSANKGRTWQSSFNLESVFNKNKTDDQTLGTTLIRLKPQDLKEAVVLSQGFVLHVDLDRDIEVFDTNTSEIRKTKKITDSALVYFGQIDFPAYSEKVKDQDFSIEKTDPHPRKIIAWNTDITQVTDVVASYKEQDQIKTIGMENYMYNVGGTLMDYSKDVRYLSMRHWILVDDSGVIKLHFSDAVLPKKTFELKGGTGSFSSFKPQVNFALWKYADNATKYMPYVFYGENKVLIVERLKDEDFGITMQSLEIPDDNGRALKPVVMYTANRRDYWFHQKGNGLFEMRYNYNPVNETSEITLVKVFSTDLGSLATVEIVNGCIQGVEPALAIDSPAGPDHLPQGTFIGYHCQGTTKVIRKADGTGGYTEEQEPNHLDCGGSPSSNVDSSTVVVGGG